MLWLIILLLIIGSFAFASMSLAPWVPAWKKDLPRIFALADLKPGEIFYDLGCGNGKVVLYANKKYQVTAIGLELALPMYLICKIRQLFNYNKNLIFKWKNLFKEDLSQADVVYFFGTPKSIEAKLKEKLEKELKPKARIISYVFPIEGWTAKVISKPQPRDMTIYLYQK